MPKSRAPDFLERLVAAATAEFAGRGYRRTQITDVARTMGTSVGSTYNYVAGKDALFLLCLEVASPANRGQFDLRALSLPVPNPAPGAISDAAQAGVAALRTPSPLGRALRRSRPPDDIASELAAIVGDIYDRTAASADFQRLLEGSARDVPELFDAFFGGARRPALGSLATYLERRIASGHLRPVPDVAATARLILETQAWFARHRRFDQDPGAIDDDVARATVIDVLVHGLLA